MELPVGVRNFYIVDSKHNVGDFLRQKKLKEKEETETLQK